MYLLLGNSHPWPTNYCFPQASHLFYPSSALLHSHWASGLPHVKLPAALPEAGRPAPGNDVTTHAKVLRTPLVLIACNCGAARLFVSAGPQQYVNFKSREIPVLLKWQESYVVCSASSVSTCEFADDILSITTRLAALNYIKNDLSEKVTGRRADPPCPTRH